MSACTVGGAEMHVLSLLDGLHRTEGYEIHLAYFTERPDRARSLKDDFEGLGVQVHDLRASSKLDPGPMVRLASLMRQQKFDIVHSHSYRSAVATAVLGGGLGYVPIVVASIHSEEPLYKNRALAHIASAVSRWQSCSIAISDAVRAHILRHTHIPATKIERIYYGIEYDVTHTVSRTGAPSLREELGVPSDTRLITIVARLGEEKGHRYAIEALSKILDGISNIRLLVVGHEDSLSEADLRRVAQAHGVEDQVVFCGFRQDIRNILGQSDLMVLPSLREGFGLVLLEAMAVGCPIVATNVGAIPEIIVDGETGLLVRPGDPAGLSSAVKRLLSSPQLVGSLVRAARERLEEHFAFNTMIQHTHSLYQRLLEHHLGDKVRVSGVRS